MSNDYSDLIARLRKPDALLDDPDLNDEAADALTAQAATIAEQARELEALRADAERLRAALVLLEKWIRDAAEEDGSRFDWVRINWEDGSTARAAMQPGKAVHPHDNRKCSKPKCNGNMRPGTYLEQTFSGVPDFPGDTHAVTVSPSGPGRLAECLKCDACGHSVTDGKAVTP